MFSVKCELNYDYKLVGIFKYLSMVFKIDYRFIVVGLMKELKSFEIRD